MFLENRKYIESYSEFKLTLALELDLISKNEYDLLIDLKSGNATHLPPKAYVKTINKICQKGFFSKHACIIPS